MQITSIMDKELDGKKKKLSKIGKAYCVYYKAATTCCTYKYAMRVFPDFLNLDTSVIWFLCKSLKQQQQQQTRTKKQINDHQNDTSHVRVLR